MKVAIKLAVWIALASTFTLFAAGQESTSPDSSSSTQTQSTDPNAKKDSAAQKPSDSSQPPKPAIEEVGAGKVAGTSNDRLFYTLPNFLTLQGTQKLPPLSTKD